MSSMTIDSTLAEKKFRFFNAEKNEPIYWVKNCQNFWPKTSPEKNSVTDSDWKGKLLLFCYFQHRGAPTNGCKWTQNQKEKKKKKFCSVNHSKKKREKGKNCGSQSTMMGQQRRQQFQKERETIQKSHHSSPESTTTVTTTTTTTATTILSPILW